MSEFKRGNYGLTGYEPPYMKLGNIQVSEEEVETVCENLSIWAEKETSLITAQFFKEYKIGYTYFQYLKHISPKLNFIWEVALAELCARWFKKIRADDENVKLGSKYLRLYDLYQLEVDTQKSMNVKREEVETKLRHEETKIKTENYSNHQLDEKYQSSYNSNINKRGSDKNSE